MYSEIIYSTYKVNAFDVHVPTTRPSYSVRPKCGMVMGFTLYRDTWYFPIRSSVFKVKNRTSPESVLCVWVRYSCLSAVCCFNTLHIHCCITFELAYVPKILLKITL